MSISRKKLVTSERLATGSANRRKSIGIALYFITLWVYTH